MKRARTPEELTANAREEKQDMLAAATRALREKDAQQRIEADKAAKLAKRRAANRERMQRLRKEDAFRELEACYCFMAPILHDENCLCVCPCCFVSECGKA
jgi:hypothetical protein